MGLKVFRTEFEELANYKFIRNDVRFLIGQTERYLSEGIRIGKYFDTGRGRVINQEYVEENEGVYPLYSSQTQDDGIFGMIDTYDFDGEYLTWTTDGANAGQVFYRNGKFTCTNVCGIAKLKKGIDLEINLKFLPYLLNTITKFYVSTASGNPKLMNNVFEEIKIPQIPKEKQDQIVIQIEPIEQKIKELKNQIQPTQTIINKVFAREFGFDLASFEELKHQSHFYLDLFNVALSKDLRSAVKFNSNKYNFLKESIFIKSTFREVINLSNTTLGRQITPNFIIEESDYYYVNANSLKNFVFDETVLTPIDVDFFNKNKHLRVEQNDILLVASGEGSIGKSAIFNSELDCITSQFVMKIGFKKNANVQYIHYYMQSIFFQLTVEKFKKGMGNMTNIFVSQLKDFPILLSEKQQQIVDEIKAELGEQEKVIKTIAEERNKIDKLIENSIWNEN